ncbi:GGDEF domain-containing protein [Novosphingobium cyanobacteriorum]|uniref:diguanylate cyclase n=1 Tax=Novosphingobium cyanobacteriorum TaxID=3024215 RepID=A0ABT6CM77_9SPHN|nr:diguanylate cyclase [Novosphingobium cyanobacteriorum]MDF8335021.1 diguanylate cyclase [Novosphingobium cyanobacteriorum]
MTHQNSSDSGRRGGWRQWFGLVPEAEDDEGPIEQPQATAAAASSRDPTAREVWLPAKRRLLGKVADFLIDHDLEVLPYTLGVAYDCVTGASPRLAQLILERTEKGMPITIQWLEEVGGEVSRDKNAEAIANLMERLEDSLDEFGQATSGARTATSEYNSALQRHVDDLQQVSKAGMVISELASLTRAMMERTRSIEGELARSEKRAQELQRSLEETRRLADQDHLTGLPNRRAFEHLLERELREAKLAHEPLSVAFCDIDHFKRINDAHGHPAGDRVLKVVADTLSRISDSKCHVARHGGEEFAVVFRGLTVEQAWQKLDDARDEISQRRLVNRANDMPFGRVTFSGGVADVFAYETKSAALKAADVALYAAKQAGRNQILIAGQDPEPIREAA